MSNNNYMDKLLKGAEVEWKSLWEMLQNTKNIKWNETDKYYQYIDLSSVSRADNTITETIEINSNNAPSRAKKIVLKNDVIFATTRPTQMRYCLIPSEYSGNVASTGYCVLRAKTNTVLSKWIFYWVSSSEFKTYLEENQSGSAYPAISDTKVKDFKIPIPPLAIQAEIVKILDTFTELTAELTAELSMRKKQYNYYRDELLTFDNSPSNVEGVGNEVGRGST